MGQVIWVCLLCSRWRTRNLLPFELTAPLLCLIMKGAIFSCSLAAASSAWLKLQDLPRGFGTRWLAGWLSGRVSDRLPSCLFGRLVGCWTNWMTERLKDEITATTATTRSTLFYAAQNSHLNKHQITSQVFFKRNFAQTFILVWWTRFESSGFKFKQRMETCVATIESNWWCIYP